MKKKLLFLIHDLGQGGAEKVLVNLVNHLDREKFDITVLSLFGGGVNEPFLSSDIHYGCVYRRNIPANSQWMKLFTPTQLHKKYIKGRYDIEVSYLEGPCARIISGCRDEHTKLISWIHTRYTQGKNVYASFRSRKEAVDCYNRFDFTACVSEDVRAAFCKFLAFQKPTGVLYNTLESEKIQELSREALDIEWDHDVFKIIAVGSLKPVKRYDRLLSIAKKLKSEGRRVHTYILGVGPLQNDFESFIAANDLNDCVSLLGYDTNPYKYLAKSDLFVCSSQTEGFSTAAAEALIVGTPVCTTEVSGMREMLGEHNEYGLITQNSEEKLYEGIKHLLDDPLLLSSYRQKARERGAAFDTQHTARAVETLLTSIYEE